jgi:hypothetical protein
MRIWHSGPEIGKNLDKLITFFHYVYIFKPNSVKLAKESDWLLAFFCVGNPKKMVSGRSVDTPDSNMGGFHRY